MTPNRRFCLPRVERLEPRQVLAAAGFIGLDDAGLLTILGTNKKDRIDVSLSGDQILVALNGAKHSFAAASVTGLLVDGKSGDDSICVADSVLVDAVLRGGSGNDKLKGGGGSDQLFGGAGHDRVDGGGGNDSLFGEAGDDKLNGNDGDDALDGGSGHDHLAGHAGNDTLQGGTGHDKLSGGDGDDALLGGEGHDTLAGDAGNDTLGGGGGNDKVKGGDGDDSLLGGAGHDELFGDAGNDTLAGEAGHDKLKGGDGDDEVLGGAGHDELFGDAGNDWLDGGDGNDKARGGAGDDKLKGGGGNDQLDGNDGANLLDGDGGKNTLKNGTEVDFETMPPPPPVDDFQPLAADLATWNGQGPSSGHAAWERQTTPAGLEKFLHVTVHGLGPDLYLPVFVNESWIGEIVTDANGFGQLKLSTIVDEPGEQPFEPGFTLAAGATVWIGESLTGSFVEV